VKELKRKLRITFPDLSEDDADHFFPAKVIMMFSIAYHIALL
jgi:hypothetical protein